MYISSIYYSISWKKLLILFDKKLSQNSLEKI